MRSSAAILASFETSETPAKSPRPQSYTSPKQQHLETFRMLKLLPEYTDVRRELHEQKLAAPQDDHDAEAGTGLSGWLLLKTGALRTA